MLKRGIPVLLLLLLASMSGCGGESSPGGEGEINPPAEPGLTVRAVSPSGLVSQSLEMPKSALVAMTAFYGSPLMQLRYVPAVDRWSEAGLISIGQDSVDVAFTPDGFTAYVTNTEDDNVHVIDVASQSVVDVIAVGDGPIGVAITPNGTTAYVPSIFDDTVSIIDVATRNVTGTIPVGSGPEMAACSPDGTRLYVTNFFDNNVTVYDVINEVVLGTIPVGQWPYGVAFTPDGTTALVANNLDSTVSIINVATATVTDTVGVGARPLNVACSPDGAVACTANEANDTVSLINMTTRLVSKTIPVEWDPHDVAFNPDGASLYVTNKGRGTVSVIDMVSQNVTGNFRVGMEPQGLAFNPDGTRAYVVNHEDSTVSVLASVQARVFIGSPGRDQGFNPPFGRNRAGAIIGRDASRVTACLMIDALTKDTLVVESGKFSGPLAIAMVAADRITRLWVDNGRPGLPPRRIIGGAQAPLPAVYSHLLLDFDGQGTLVNVLPTKARDVQSDGSVYRMQDPGDGTVTLQGDFLEVYEVATDCHVAPGGASTVTIDAVTGQVLAVK